MKKQDQTGVRVANMPDVLAVATWPRGDGKEGCVLRVRRDGAPAAAIASGYMTRDGAFVVLGHVREVRANELRGAITGLTRILREIESRTDEQ